MIGRRLGVGASRRLSSERSFEDALLKFLLFANQIYTHVKTASKSDNKLVDEEIRDGNDNRKNIIF